MDPRSKRRSSARGTSIAAAACLVAGVGGAGAAFARAPVAARSPAGPPAAVPDLVAEVAACAAAPALTPEEVPLRPTQSAPGAEGRMTLRLSDSPYGIAVSGDGRYVHDVTIEVTSLRRKANRVYVVWAATPELDRFTKLGTLDAGGRVEGEISFNKFLVFVSEEADAGVERWTGPIVLTGLSPSGRMHTMAGHGPFEGVDCMQVY